MEKCYIIKYKSIEIGITLKRVEDLRPHEEVDIRHLTGIMHALITLQLIRHPIIVDKHTNVILDGAHRFEALKRIGCKTIPVSLMDYSDERIIILKWITKIHTDNKMCVDKILAKYSDKVLTSKGEKLLKDLVQLSELALFYNNLFILQMNEHKGILDKLISEIKSRFPKFEYITEEDFLREVANQTRSDYLYILPRKVTKKEVIEAALEARLFPPKTTRHFFPAKVYNVNYPLNYCLHDNFNEINKKFYEYLLNKKLIKRESPCNMEEKMNTDVCFIFE